MPTSRVTLQIICAAVLALGLGACAKPAEAPPSYDASWLFLNEPRKKAQHPLEKKPWHQSPGWSAYSYSSSSMYFEISWAEVLELRPGMRADEVKDLVGPLMFGSTDNAVVFAVYPEDEWQYEVALKFDQSRSILEEISFLAAPGAAERLKLQHLK